MILKRNTLGLVLLLLSSWIYSQSQLEIIKCNNFDCLVTVDSDFIGKIRLIEAYAVENNLEIVIQQSFRVLGEKVENKIVNPYFRSNHFVGHAIDINIKFNGILFNSTKMKKYDELPYEVKSFIQYCRNNGIRWGGDFTIPDVVHFDDGIGDLNYLIYNRLFSKYQKVFFLRLY